MELKEWVHTPYHGKPYADSTLRSMTKDWLIHIIRDYEHNYNALYEANERGIQAATKMLTDGKEELSKLADAIPHICECCVGCEMEKPGGSCPHGFIPSAKRTQEYIAGMQKKYDEVLKAAKQMHLWIFLNSVDEQEAYDECGLTAGMNAALGYGGQYVVDPPKEEA